MLRGGSWSCNTPKMHYYVIYEQFSGDSVGIRKPDMPNIWPIWNPDFLKAGFQMVGFLNGRAFASHNHSKTRPFKIRTFDRISNGFWQNGSHLSWFNCPLYWSALLTWAQTGIQGINTIPVIGGCVRYSNAIQIIH